MPQSRKPRSGSKHPAGGAGRGTAAAGAGDRGSAAREAVARATEIGEARDAARAAARPAGRGRPSDPFTAELRRREVLPLLILHYICANPSYGNQLIDRISAVTAGVVSVNPNTMYPLLRQLEERELIEGRWEHPERRSRRYYSVTPGGREEYERLRAEVRPFLDSVARSIDEIVREVFG